MTLIPLPTNGNIAFQGLVRQSVTCALLSCSDVLEATLEMCKFFLVNHCCPLKVSKRWNILRSAVVTALRRILLKVSPSQQKSSGSSGGGFASESSFAQSWEAPFAFDSLLYDHQKQVRDKCDPDLYLDGISFQRIAYGNQSCKGRLQKDGNTLFHLLMQVDDTQRLYVWTIYLRVRHPAGHDINWQNFQRTHFIYCQSRLGVENF